MKAQKCSALVSGMPVKDDQLFILSTSDECCSVSSLSMCICMKLSLEERRKKYLANNYVGS